MTQSKTDASPVSGQDQDEQLQDAFQGITRESIQDAATQETSHGTTPDNRPPGGLRFSQVSFIDSVFSLSRLPASVLPEAAFAGRSNVGKSSLMNCLMKRKNLVKVSARPGKTQSLNYYLVDNAAHLVDLPGYGFAKVGRATQDAWRELIGGYLASRPVLRLVVVIIDLRHALKELDRMLVDWLNSQGIPCLPVYTKADKLSRNEQQKQAKGLDAALGISPRERIIFSAKTGEGRAALVARLNQVFFPAEAEQPVNSQDMSISQPTTQQDDEHG